MLPCLMLSSRSPQSLSAFLPPPLPNSLALLPRLSPACSATKQNPTVSDNYAPPHRPHSLQQSATMSFLAICLSFVFILLRTLLSHAKCQILYFQALPHSLAKTPGVGVTCFKRKAPERPWKPLGSRFTEHELQFTSYPERRTEPGRLLLVNRDFLTLAWFISFQQK